MKSYVGLGSNVGARRAQLRAALLALRGHPAVAALRVSPLYETRHVGPGEQPNHLNACAELECSLAPTDLLAVLRQLERDAGRPADGHGLPRTLDLDLLLHGDCVRGDADCTLPHPRMHQRRFVLEPLNELQPQLRLPGEARMIAELLELPEIARQSVRRIADASWWLEEMTSWTK